MTADPLAEHTRQAERWLRDGVKPARPLPDLGDDWDVDFDGALIGDWWAEPASTPIYDAIVMESLLAATPRPPLWTRIGDGWIAAGVLVLLGVLLALPLVYA